MNKRAVGSKYEQLAASHLTAIGYVILEQNYYSPHGEIDIIASDQGTLVFVEVKYRKNASSGYPQEAVTKTKQQAIRYTARHYLYKHRFCENTQCRFDIVSILADQITLIKDAF